MKPYCIAYFLNGDTLALPMVDDAAMAWDIAEDLGTVRAVWKLTPTHKYPGFCIKETHHVRP